MHKIVIPFLGQDLEVFLAHDLSPTKLFDVEEACLNLVDHYLHIFGFGFPNSELERLNTSDINFPVQVSEHLWEYLKANLAVSEQSKGKITPFMANYKPLPHPEVESAFELQPEDRVVIRKQPITLSAATIAAPFIISQVEKKLQSLNVRTFLISYHNLHLGRGTDQWEVSFDQPDSSEQLNVIITNEAIYMLLEPTGVEPEPSLTPNPFHSPDAHVNYAAIIVEAETPLRAKLIANLARELTYEYQFPAFANTWGCGITLFMANGDLKQYSALV